MDLLIDQRDAGTALNLLDQYDNSSDRSLQQLPELITVKAKALYALGQHSAALRLFRETTELFSDWPDGWNNYGCCLLDLGRNAEASAKFKCALHLSPCHVKAALGLVSIYKRNSDFKECTRILINCLDHCSSSEPVLIENLIDILHLDGENDQALQWALTLLKIPSEKNLIHRQMLLSRSYFLVGDISSYVKTLQRCPEGAVWNGVSVRSMADAIIAECGLCESACHDSSHLAKNSQSDPSLNLVIARQFLREYDFENGWRHYSFRLKLPNPQLHLEQPVDWDGSTIKDCNVLVIGEQGLGDVCCFARFLNPLSAENNCVSVCCEARMLDFLQTTFPQIYFFSDPNSIRFLPKPMVKIALGSLPLLYGMSSAEIQNHGASMQWQVREADRGLWSQRLASVAGDSLLLGISLMGGRQEDEYQKRKRSLPIRKTLELFKGREVVLVDLQHPKHPEEFEQISDELGLQVLRFPCLTDDVQQLLTVMSCLDGLLTAQQTNAHLAAAVGLRSLVALPSVSHFVYGLDSSTIWYPSLQLVRSHNFGDWDDCIDELRNRLEGWPMAKGITRSGLFIVPW